MNLHENTLLLEGEQLKTVLEQSFSECNTNITIISAYITRAGVDWLLQHIPEKVHVTLICRLLPGDVISGSTNISALDSALNHNWKVACLHALHAKIYIIGDYKMYVGSANLTNNGLKIYGTGNIEACIAVNPHKYNLDFIKKITDSSVPITKNILEQMQNHVNKKTVKTDSDIWPENLLKLPNDLWVRDLFWCNLLEPNNSSDKTNHDLDILKLNDFQPESLEFKEKVKKSRAMIWFFNQLTEANNNELYFGAITHALHNTLKDDPVPYRKDVKTLLQNLISYCQVCLPESIEISRPKHSQKVKLLMTR